MAAEVREFVRQRAGDRCEYCLLPAESDELPFHLEHIIAKQHGGSDDLENLCWSCSRCNFYKGTNLAGLDPRTRSLTPLYDRRTQPWAMHFAFRGPRIVGVTATGRTTVRLLHMNEMRRVDLRRDLMERRIMPS